MAVLQRHKSTVYGLVTDLAQLAAADTAEATARAAADTTLQGNIDAEANARAAADTTLQGNITTEATTRADADTALGGRVDNVNTAAGLVGDAYVAPTGTSYLGSASSLVNADVKLDVAIKSAADAIAAEITARTSADTTLQNNIDAEASARATADTTLQSNITAEASARAAADTTLQGNIDAEAAARVSGDEAAQSYADGILAAFVAGDFATLDALVAVINSDSTVEGSFRKAIADVIASAPEALDTLNEIATYINVAGTGDDVLTAIVNSVTAAKDEIRGEVSAAYDTLAEVETALNIINGASTVEGSIAKVAADAAAATTAEATARAAADTTLQGNIDAEEAARIAGDTTNANAITAEASARASADTTLQGNIDAEATARASADTTLQSNIDAEASARASADTTLQSNITAEATARAAADTTLTNGLANLSGVTDAATARTNLDIYSTSEVDTAIANGGAIFITEILTVGSDAITLTHEPKNGMIFNFATVRHTDANFVSYDIPVTVGGSAKVYNLSPNSAGEFDGKAVVVQYAYAPTA